MVNNTDSAPMFNQIGKVVKRAQRYDQTEEKRSIALFTKEINQNSSVGLIDYALFHHEIHLFQHRDIRQRIPRNGDKVCGATR